MDMFDDDDTLMYEPAQTAAIILTGDDEEAEKAALEVGNIFAWSCSAPVLFMWSFQVVAVWDVLLLSSALAQCSFGLVTCNDAKPF